MSSSIAIPKRKQAMRIQPASYASESSSSASSSFSSPPASSPRHSDAADPPLPPPSPRRSADRRPSLLGSSISQSTYTVINLGHGDGPPRLVTCVKSSQGFDWNQELFLPSCADYQSSDLERKPDPVEDIVLTDEEAESILPQ